MDYYQGVVLNYLRSDRAVFVNPECLIQLVDGPVPPKGSHWYCDAVAIDLRNEVVFLCEITYAAGLSALIGRLKAWAQNWSAIRDSLAKNCCVNGCWPVRPWLFVPEEFVPALVLKLQGIKAADGTPVFQPRITPLESVGPWKFKDWDHQDMNTKKPDCIPAEMCL
jgi:hypothetical protein